MLDEIKKCSVNEDEDTTLDTLLEGKEIKLDEETGLPVKSVKHGKSSHFSDLEVSSVILPYICNDIAISNRAIEEATGLDRRVVGRVRKSRVFVKLLAEHTNRQMVEGRSIAVEKLVDILKSVKSSDNSKIKSAQVLLQHSEKMAELVAESSKNKPDINVEAVLNELDKLKQ